VHGPFFAEREPEDGPHGLGGREGGGAERLAKMDGAGLETTDPPGHPKKKEKKENSKRRARYKSRAAMKNRPTQLDSVIVKKKPIPEVAKLSHQEKATEYQ